MDQTKKIVNLEKRITRLEEELTRIKNYIIYTEVKDFGIDPAYYEATKLLAGRKFITFKWLQSRLQVGFARMGNILDKLEHKGKIFPKEYGHEKRKVKA